MNASEIAIVKSLSSDYPTESWGLLQQSLPSTSGQSFPASWKFLNNPDFWFQKAAKNPSIKPLPYQKTKWNSTAHYCIYYLLLYVCIIALEPVALRGCGCHVPGSVQDQSEQVGSSCAYARHRVGIKWSLRSLSTHPFCDPMILWPRDCLSRQRNILGPRSTTSKFRWPKNGM